MRIEVPLGNKDEACARSAAQWVTRFHPGVTAVVNGDTVELDYDAADAALLARIWNAALLNERSFHENGSRRNQLLKRLAE